MRTTTSQVSPEATSATFPESVRLKHVSHDWFIILNRIIPKGKSVRFPTVPSFLPQGLLFCQAAYQVRCSGQTNSTGPFAVSASPDTRSRLKMRHEAKIGRYLKSILKRSVLNSCIWKIAVDNHQCKRELGHICTHLNRKLFRVRTRKSQSLKVKNENIQSPCSE